MHSYISMALRHTLAQSSHTISQTSIHPEPIHQCIIPYSLITTESIFLHTIRHIIR
jgi:hypothetical protein